MVKASHKANTLFSLFENNAMEMSVSVWFINQFTKALWRAIVVDFFDFFLCRRFSLVTTTLVFARHIHSLWKLFENFLMSKMRGGAAKPCNYGGDEKQWKHHSKYLLAQWISISHNILLTFFFFLWIGLLFVGFNRRNESSVSLTKYQCTGHRLNNIPLHLVTFAATVTCASFNNCLMQFRPRNKITQSIAFDVMEGTATAAAPTHSLHFLRFSFPFFHY